GGRFGGGLGDAGGGRSEGFDFAPVAAAAAADQRAGVAHRAARRGGPAGHERDDRFGVAGRDQIGGALLVAAADLADQDDGPRDRIGGEARQDGREVAALERVPADADPGALAQPAAEQLVGDLVGEGPAAGDDPDRTGRADAV